MKYIHALQSKPERTRHTIAFTIALAITLLIGFFWVRGLPNELGVDNTASVRESVARKDKEVSANTLSGETPSPFQVFKNIFK